VSCLSDCYKRKPTLRLRPVDEWQACVAYTPEHPKLVLLNATAWLILELCDGNNVEDLERQFWELIGTNAETENTPEVFSSGIRLLLENGLIDKINGGEKDERK